jgi:hypothetical protein
MPLFIPQILPIEVPIPGSDRQKLLDLTEIRREE